MSNRYLWGFSQEVESKNACGLVGEVRGNRIWSEPVSGFFLQQYRRSGFDGVTIFSF